MSASAFNSYYDPRSPAVQAIASAVESVAAVGSSVLPIVTSTTFISVCGAFGSLAMAKYAIDVAAEDEDAFIGKKIDEMFSFVTSSEILDTQQSFVDLVRELSEAQSTMTLDVDRVREEKYRSLSKSLLQYLV